MKALNIIKKIVVAIAIPIVLFLLLWILAPDKISMTSFVSVLTQAVLPAVLAWGVAFNIKVGNWDFSVGANVLAASIIGGNLAKLWNLGVVGLLVFCVVFAVICATITGLIFRFLKIPSIIASIGMMLIIESICGIVFDGAGVMVGPEFMSVGGLQLGNMWFKLGIGIVIGALAFYLYNFRRFGYNVRAVGNGPSVARLNGIDVYKVKTLAFIACGVFCGLYAWLNLGSSGVTKTVSSMGTMGTCFDAMMCVFVGMSLGNFANLMIGVYIGSVTMQIVKLALMVLGFPSMYNQVIIALFVLIFMAVSSRSDVFAKIKLKRQMKAELSGDNKAAL